MYMIKRIYTAIQSATSFFDIRSMLRQLKKRKIAKQRRIFPHLSILANWRN